MPTPALREFLRRLPKTETHLHIEGALPYELLAELDPVKYAAPPPSHAPGFRYGSFPEFEAHLLALAVPWFTSAERYHRAAAEIFARQAAQTVRYVEISFHAGIIAATGIPGREILHAIRSAAPAGLPVRVFLGMARNAYEGPMIPVLEDALGWEDLAGIDLHGLESRPLGGWTPGYWARARAAGKVTKAHAGEFGPAANVRQAVELLGVRRVQHGVRAVEDPAVVRLCAELGVVFDVCPGSNVKLAVEGVTSLRGHPLRALLAAGVACTVSTDDPLVFGNTLTGEYEDLADAGLTAAELAAVARHGFRAALLPDAAKAAALAEIDALAAEFAAAAATTAVAAASAEAARNGNGVGFGA